MGTMKTISEVKGAIETRRVSAREVAAEYFKRISAQNKGLNAYLTLCEERAYKQADRVDALVAAGKQLPPLAGVPVAVKDVISTRGGRTPCGSKILSNYVPPYDATAVHRLESAGAVILGKTNCDEFAMGSSNENSAYGPVRNPVAPDRVPGGSSGGSAAVGGQGGGAGGGRGRFDPPAGVVLRRSRCDADLRPGFALRPDGVCQLAGSHWPAG